MKEIKIPGKKHTVELEVKRSRFIATVEPAGSPDEVKILLKSIRENHPNSSHVVYAFFTGDDRSQSGMSDDGEPHGTAGRPIYEVLKGSGLTDVLLSVIRYFGGTKLGTGGLVSAYGQAAKNVLDGLPVKEKIYTIKIRMNMEYRFFDQIKKFLVESGAIELTEDFSTEVSLTAGIPLEKRDEILRNIIDISRGEVNPVFV